MNSYHNPGRKTGHACCLLFFLLALVSQRAISAPREIIVGSVNELHSSLSTARPGDALVLKDGRYNAAFNLSATGTAEQPIVVRPQTLGGATILRPVKIRAKYLSFVGFRFSEQGSISVTRSRGCRISRCHMNNLQPRQWITVDAKSRNIELDHNLLENKQNNRTNRRGCQMVRFKLSNTGERHHIHHNHFRDIPKGGDGNGFESLQLITQGNPFDPGEEHTGNVIESNLFEHCDGEAEIISVKSSGTILRGNTFRASSGALVLRHGHANTVTRNWFLGEHKRGSGGVRLQGRDHVVENNYFDRLASFAIAMMDGTPDQLYVRVERARSRTIRW